MAPSRATNSNLLDRILSLFGRKAGSPAPVRKSNRASSVDVDRLRETSGVGQDWAKRVYGEYYATSVPIYSAIRVRSEALVRPRVRVLRDAVGKWAPVGDDHPALRLLDRANRWQTRGDLWRATETYLNLWGTAFWALERDDRGQWELWTLRPDRMRVIPDKQKYIKGFVYMGVLGPVAYTAEEMVWIRYFNPLEEYAGLSPVAPVRLSVDMGLDALKFNRSFFKNYAMPDVIFTTEEAMSDEEVDDFYERWEKRYRGPGNAHRPAIASFIKDIKTVSNVGFSQKEMEFVQGLRWSLEDVSRVYGVPLPLLSDYQHATFANINTAERLFWRNTMVPEIKFIEEQLNEKLLPQLGYPELRVEFDLSDVEALREDEDNRVERESKLLDRGVLTINEVRRQHDLPDVPWGDTPFVRSGSQNGRGTESLIWSGNIKGN